MITFGIAAPRAESATGRLKDPVDVLLGVVADVRFLAGEHVLLSMPDFPIVELAAQLDYWLRHGADGDFSYESAEADEELLWLRWIGDRVFIGSDLPQAPTKHPTTRDAAVEFARTYINWVRDEVKERLGVDVSSALKLRR